MNNDIDINLCAVAISELPELTAQISDDSVLVVSQKNGDELYDSGKVSYRRLRTQLSGDLRVGEIMENYDDLREKFDSLSNDLCALKTDNHVCADIAPPYIISAWHEKFGHAVSCEAYRLSAGMDYEFKHCGFDEISVVSGFVDNLSAKYGQIDSLSVINLSAKYGQIDSLSVLSLCISGDNDALGHKLLSRAEYNRLSAAGEIRPHGIYCISDDVGDNDVLGHKLLSLTEYNRLSAAGEIHPHGIYCISDDVDEDCLPYSLSSVNGLSGQNGNVNFSYLSAISSDSDLLSIKVENSVGTISFTKNIEFGFPDYSDSCIDIIAEVSASEYTAPKNEYTVSANGWIYVASGYPTDPGHASDRPILCIEKVENDIIKHYDVFKCNIGDGWSTTIFPIRKGEKIASYNSYAITGYQQILELTLYNKLIFYYCC